MNQKYKDQIKVVQFIGAMNVGGSENLLMNIYRNIDRAKYKFIFMENIAEKTHYTDEILRLGGEVVKMPVFSLKNTVPYYRSLAKYFKNYDIDTVHAHTYLHSWIVLAAAKNAGIKKRVAHAHSAMQKYDNGSKFKWWFLKKLLLYYATDLAACSTDANNDLFNGHKDAVIVKNPVDLSRFYNISDKSVSELRRTLNIKNKQLVIGHIGRIEKPKNPIFICNIIKLLADKNLDVTLLWLGDGSMKAEVEKYINDNGLNNHIQLVGIVDDVPTYIKLFDVFIMPSLWEGLSLAAVEVQSQGIPCLFSDTTSRDTKVNKNIMFLPIDSPNVWAEAIVRRPNKVSTKESIQNILNKGFNIENTVHKFVDIYGLYTSKKNRET